MAICEQKTKHTSQTTYTHTFPLMSQTTFTHTFPFMSQTT